MEKESQRLEMSESLKDHYNTGLKLVRGRKFDTYELGGDVNSKSQIIVVKGDTKIQMNSIDGKLGGGIQIQFDRNTSKRYNSISFKVKKYEEALQHIHALMRMLK